MPRIRVLIAATLLALASMAGPALAFQPPGAGAQDRFDCVESAPEGLEPVAGHPGAAGLYDNGAHLRAVENSDGNSTTAWKPALNDENPVGSSCD